MGAKGKTKYNYDEVKQTLESKGYILLSNELCSSDKKLDYICLKHQDKGVQHISVYHAMNDRGCYYCGRERTNAGRMAKIDKEADRRLCEQRGFEYIDTVIENHIVWIEMICPQHKHVGVQRVKQANLKRENTHKCIYCIGRKVHPFDSFGRKHKEAVALWGDQNQKTPFEYAPSSNQQVWFRCENGIHKDYRRSINEVHRRGFRCPECAKLHKESCLQQKVRLYFNDLGYSLLHEYECTIIDTNPINGYKMPYDNQEDNTLKLIVEVHGRQHYEVDKLTIMQALRQNKEPEEILKYQQWRDKHKREYALSCGYHYLEIPYWAIKNEIYKTLINDKIQEVLLNTNNIICSNN